MIGGLTLFLIVHVCASQSQDSTPTGGHYVKVEVKGTLEHGVVAIGGETTGTIITAGQLTWDLDLSQRQEFAELAARLNGKTAIVTGILQRFKGVEVPERRVVTVTSLKGSE